MRMWIGGLFKLQAEALTARLNCSVDVGCSLGNGRVVWSDLLQRMAWQEEYELVKR